MRSTSGTSKGSGFAIQGGMFVVRYGTNKTLLRREAARAGIEPTEVKHETVVEGIAQAMENFERITDRTAEKVAAILRGENLPAIAAAAIAAAVEKQLSDDFQRVEGAIADVPAETVDELGSRLSG